MQKIHGIETERYALHLVRAPDDPQLFSPEYHAELRRCTSAFPEGFRSRAFAMDSASGGGGPLGEFIFANGSALITAVGAAVGAWLGTRTGRKVRIKYGDLEVEATSVAEVSALIALLEAAESRDPDWPQEQK